MNWSGIVRSLLHAKSITNALVMVAAGYGVATLLHVPGDWRIYVALGAVIVNQIGLQQQQPGA